MLLKLYKRDGERIRYWETWDEKRELVIHAGVLGHKGTTRRIPLRRLERVTTAVQREATEARAAGYRELPIEAHAQVVVQYQTPAWGDATDLAKRHKVEHILNECLGWTGNGHCDGGDIGSGTINTFSFVLDPALAMKSIVAALRKEDLLAGAVIAVEENETYTVLWPPDHTTDFRLWYGA